MNTLDKPGNIFNLIFHRISRGIRFIFTLPIHLYRHLISPLLPGACIYTPSCSAYSSNAIMRHGVIKGFILGVSRIFRCAGGLFTGGEDPVPEEFSLRDIGSKYKKFYARGRKNRN
ncbi:MAG: membrane protein insertion efficiency factor YidD [Spirochaetaceae bacterium]